MGEWDVDRFCLISLMKAGIHLANLGDKRKTFFDKVWFFGHMYTT